ncbi:cytochrome c [Hydrogenovibrio kuenenii]|uniref:cytochrome c n=1 Tax=Hydrogenovibrio kuenenii TaxID=63658 RepID=UPI00057100F8|nr:cytochrome c [Hydrogenovibrio kuenenii]
MNRIIFLLSTSVLLFAVQPAYSEEITPSGGDLRQLVSMPDQAREFMRKDMLDHLSALNEIIGYLAENKLDAAADVAETRMGRTSMGKHRGTGMGPGRFMPLEMRKLGWGMHDAASEFSKIAKQGDIKSAYSALQKITSSCVACHYSYRTR